MSEIDWTNEQIIHLVNEYKNRPMLWDPTHDMYRAQSAKYEVWCDIAETFQCEISDIRKKINSIFASHRREKAKVRSGGRSTWFLYNYMNFLPNHIENDDSAEPAVIGSTQKKRNPKKNKMIEEEKETSDEEDDRDDGPIHIIVKEETDVEKTPPKMPFRRKPRLRRVIKRRIVQDSERHNVIERKLVKRSEYSKKDECDTFGEYIAVSLRKHDERTRSMIKQAINNILFEQEMKKYNGGQHYAVVLSEMDDTNPLILGDECEK